MHIWSCTAIQVCKYALSLLQIMKWRYCTSFPLKLWSLVFKSQTKLYARTKKVKGRHAIIANQHRNMCACPMCYWWYLRNTRIQHINCLIPQLRFYLYSKVLCICKVRNAVLTSIMSLGTTWWWACKDNVSQSLTHKVRLKDSQNCSWANSGLCVCGFTYRYKYIYINCGGCQFTQMYSRRRDLLHSTHSLF